MQLHHGHFRSDLPLQKRRDGVGLPEGLAEKNNKGWFTAGYLASQRFGPDIELYITHVIHGRALRHIAEQSLHAMKDH